MNRYWEIASLVCTHDLEDKLSLCSIEPLPDHPLAVCQIELRESTSYQPPKSTAVQAQICRFMQEAIHAQFHLLKMAGQLFNQEKLDHALKIANQQLEFFLKNHQWQAQIHAAIFIPSSLIQEPSSPAPSLLRSSALPAAAMHETPLSEKAKKKRAQIRRKEQLTILCVGQPNLFSFSLETNELNSLFSQEGHPHRCFGEVFPFTYEQFSIALRNTQRFLLGNSNWQQVHPSRLKLLFKDNWLSLPEPINLMVNSSELDNHPFYFIEITPPIGQWKKWLTITFSQWQRRIHRLVPQLTPK